MKPKKQIKQFRIDGTYIRTLPSTWKAKEHGDENGKFSETSIARCARGERLTYRGYIWMYKEDYTKEKLDERVIRANSRWEALRKPIISVDRDGKITDRFESIMSASENHYVSATNMINHLKRRPNHSTCLGKVWYYEKEYLKGKMN